MGQTTGKTALVASGLGLAAVLFMLKRRASPRTHIVCVGHSSVGANQSGKPIYRITLDNGRGVCVCILSLGCCLSHVFLTKCGQTVDVVMGYESLAEYERGKQNLGTIVGRCANRIKHGRFVLDGQEFQLDVNNGQNHLHGGREGFFSRVFEVESCGVVQDCAHVALSYVSPDRDQGYPGSLLVRTEISLNQNNELRIVYSGKVTQDAPRATIVNMCNHAYWNLGGHSSGSVMDHELTINATHYTPVDAGMIPTGEVVSVAGTAYDFRTSTRLGQRLRETPNKCGFDVNFVLHDRGLCFDDAKQPSADAASRRRHADEEKVSRGSMSLAAILAHPTSGRRMTVHTNAPGLQLYTGNFINPGDSVWKGKGAQWDRFGAVCLETQNWPDAINHQHFPSPIIRPEQIYQHEIVHKFFL